MKVRETEMYNQRCSKLGLRVLLAVDEYKCISIITNVSHAYIMAQNPRKTLKT